MEEKILEIIASINDELLEYEGNNMLEDGIVNSFSFISLVSELEDEFDIDIDEDLLDAKYFGNKNRIIETVKSIIEE